MEKTLISKMETQFPFFGLMSLLYGMIFAFVCTVTSMVLRSDSYCGYNIVGVRYVKRLATIQDIHGLYLGMICLHSSL